MSGRSQALLLVVAVGCALGGLHVATDPRFAEGIAAGIVIALVGFESRR